MKQKKVSTKIFDEVYRHDVLFIAGCELEEVNKELKKYKIKPWIPDVRPKGIMRVFSEDDSPGVTGNPMLIWVRDRKDFYTLLHVVTHLCIEVFDLSNMDVDKHTTEAFAFYHEFWFKTLWRVMSKK